MVADGAERDCRVHRDRAPRAPPTRVAVPYFPTTDCMRALPAESALGAAPSGRRSRRYRLRARAAQTGTYTLARSAAVGRKAYVLSGTVSTLTNFAEPLPLPSHTTPPGDPPAAGRDDGGTSPYGA